jgi:hypothetical protein
MLLFGGVYDRRAGYPISGLDAHRLHQASNTSQTHRKTRIGEVTGKQACSVAWIIHVTDVDQTHDFRILITGMSRGETKSIAMNFQGRTLLDNAQSTLFNRLTCDIAVHQLAPLLQGHQSNFFEPVHRDHQRSNLLVQLCLLLLIGLNIYNWTINKNLLRAVQNFMIPSRDLCRVKPIALTELSKRLELLESIKHHVSPEAGRALTVTLLRGVGQ